MMLGCKGLTNASHAAVRRFSSDHRCDKNCCSCHILTCSVTTRHLLVLMLKRAKCSEWNVIYGSVLCTIKT